MAGTHSGSHLSRQRRLRTDVIELHSINQEGLESHHLDETHPVPAAVHKRLSLSPVTDIGLHEKVPISIPQFKSILLPPPQPLYDTSLPWK